MTSQDCAIMGICLLTLLIVYRTVIYRTYKKEREYIYIIHTRYTKGIEELIFKRARSKLREYVDRRIVSEYIRINKLEDL